MTAPKPATGLPWAVGAAVTNGRTGSASPAIETPATSGAARQVIANLVLISGARENAAYIVHAANAYPQLVAALRDLMLRCDGDEGVRADGSNIQTIEASALLQSLGEL